MPLHTENNFELCKSTSRTSVFRVKNHMIYVTITAQKVPSLIEEEDTAYKNVGECLEFLGSMLKYSDFEKDYLCLE